MTKLVIDPELRASLNRSLEFTDAAGRTVGFFITPEEHERLRKAEEDQLRREYARAHALFTDDRLDAANREGGEYTTEEVVRQLDSLNSRPNC